MIVKHNNKTPKIHPSAYVAPNAVICGDVKIGANTRVMFGAQVIAENNPISIGDNCIILENAVLRGTFDHTLSIGNNCLLGPNSHVTGCLLEDNVFIATGASIFHGAMILKGAEVRVNGVVHLKTVVPAGFIIPIGWVAVGDPMEMYPPNEHEKIWTIQKELNFTGAVYGLWEEESQETSIAKICQVMSERLGTHKNDEVI